MKKSDRKNNELIIYVKSSIRVKFIIDNENFYVNPPIRILYENDIERENKEVSISYALSTIKAYLEEYSYCTLNDMFYDKENIIPCIKQFINDAIDLALN